MVKWVARLTRDIVILTIALGIGVYEVIIGGGRPAVLAFATGLILSPLVIRVDEHRRERAHDNDKSSD